MSRDYRVLIDFEALDSLPRTGKRRTDIISFLRSLGTHAYQGGDFQLRDAQTQRIFEVTVLRGYAITWWIDAPVNEVKVIDIRHSK
jgi:hypothetical protein